MLKYCRIFIPLIFLMIIHQKNYAKIIKKEHIELELISEYQTITQDQYFWIAIRLKMEDKWHIYWKNPGDGGRKTLIKWKIPKELKLIKNHWPYPKKINLLNNFIYGYENEIFIMAQIKVNKFIKINQKLEIKAKINWLICKEICLPPNETKLKLKLIVKNKPKIWNKWYKILKKAKLKLPIKTKKLTFEAIQQNNKILFYIKKNNNQKLSNIQFFSEIPKIITTSKQKWLTIKENYLGILKIDKTKNKIKKLKGIIVGKNLFKESNRNSIKVNIYIKNKFKDNKILILLNQKLKKNIKQNINISNLWIGLVFAFLGGLILNIMPCVLPILSLKILNFINQSGSSKYKIRQHALFFTLGIFISFWILVSILLILRSATYSLGWGFQLQSPLFIMIITTLFFALSLNLFGVFEIGLFLTKTSVIGIKQKGLANSFITGMLATISATPCSAPILGSAIGFALTVTPLKTFLIFNIIASGMSFPYLLLSFFPKFLSKLPKPGIWIIKLKQFMGFLLMFSVIYLIWVLGTQTNINHLSQFLLYLTLLGMSLWLFGQWKNLKKSLSIRLIFKVITILSFIISLYFMPILKKDTNKLKWKKFSPELITNLKKTNQAIFINFTATWCLTCQSNKIFAIETKKVIAKFKELKVETVKADWTKKNQVITNELAKYRRAAIPFYLLYTGIEKENPLILPEILTENIMLRYLNQIKIK